jgi:hypothetical protein
VGKYRDYGAKRFSIDFDPVQAEWFLGRLDTIYEDPELEYQGSIDVRSYLPSFTDWSWLPDVSKLHLNVVERDVFDQMTSISATSMLKSCILMWKTLRNSPFAMILSKSVAIYLYLGFHPSGTTREIEGFAGNIPKITGTLTFLDHMATVIDYVIDIVPLYIATGNIQVLKCWNGKAVFFQDLYSQIEQLHTNLTVNAHEMEDQGHEHANFQMLLKKATMIYRSNLMDIDDPTTQRLARAQYAQMMAWNMELTHKIRQSEVVRQGFHVVLAGKPGCGKTVITTLIYNIMCAAEGISFDNVLVATLSELRKYDDVVEAGTAFLTLEEMGQSLKPDTQSHVETIVFAYNNRAWMPKKAELEQKGVSVALRGGVTTTNQESYEHAANKVKSLAAVRRRTQAWVEMSSRDEFSDKNGVLDISRAAYAPTKLTVGGQEFLDVQRFTIKKDDTCDRGMEVLDPRNGQRRRLENLDIVEFAFFIERMYRQHSEEQKKFVRSQNQNARVQACPKCSRVICCCEAEPKYELVVLEGLPDTRVKELVENPPKVDLRDAQMNPETQEKQGVGDIVLHAAQSQAERFGLAWLKSQFGIWWLPDWIIKTGWFRNRLTDQVGEYLTGCLPLQEYKWMPDGQWKFRFMYMHYGDKLTAAATSPPMRWFLKACTAAIYYSYGKVVYKFLNKKGLDRQGLTNTLATHLAMASFKLATQIVGWTYLNRKRAVYHATLRAETKKAKDLLSSKSRVYAAVRNSEVWKWLPLTGMLGWGLHRTGYVQKLYSGLIPKRNRSALVAKSAQWSFDPWEEAYDREAPNPEPTIEEMLNEEPPSDGEEEYCYFGEELDKEEQGFMFKTDKEVQELDSRPQMFTPLTPTIRPLKNPGATAEGLRKHLARQSFLMYREEANGDLKYATGGVMIADSTAIIPKHMVPGVRKTFLFQGLGSTELRRIELGPKNFFPCSQDLALFNPHWKSVKDLRSYLYRDVPASSRLDLFALKGKGDGLENSSKWVLARRVDAGTASLMGSESYKGLCGSPYLCSNSAGRDPGILGFHYAGHTLDRTKVFYALPTEQELQAYAGWIASTPGTLVLSHLPPKFRTIGDVRFIDQQYTGKEYSIFDTINWLAEKDGVVVPDPKALSSEREIMSINDALHQDGTDVDYSVYVNRAISLLRVGEDNLEWQGGEYIGARRVTAYSKSRYKDSPLKADVLEVAPPGLDFGPPKFRRTMFEEGARKATRVLVTPCQDELSWAVQDYLDPFIKAGSSMPGFKDIRPLTLDEALNGVMEFRFIRSMNFKTSAGPGLPGGKMQYIREFLDETGRIKRSLKPEVKKILLDFTCRLLHGHRGPAYFSTVPKDELIPVEKDKVRLFYLGEFVLSILGRLQFGTVLRFLQLNPGWSEILVGIDCLSPEWDQFMKHLETFSKFYDGDFSGFDTSEDCAYTKSAWYIMIFLNKMSGRFTRDDLVVQNGIASECVHPVVAYATSVLLLDKTNPSGHILTVIINSLVNSLLHRTFYKRQYPAARIGSFRDWNSPGTYGDDFIMATHWTCWKMNFLAFQKYCAAIGMKLTPANKEDRGTAYKPLKEIEFLKRVDYYNPFLKHRVGLLSEKSIFKSLIGHIRTGGISEEDLVAQTMDAALIEWAHYPREHFVKRQSEMLDIATKHFIEHLVPNLHRSREEILRRRHNL